MILQSAIIACIEWVLASACLKSCVLGKECDFKKNMRVKGLKNPFVLLPAIALF